MTAVVGELFETMVAKPSFANAPETFVSAEVVAALQAQFRASLEDELRRQYEALWYVKVGGGASYVAGKLVSVVGWIPLPGRMVASSKTERVLVGAALCYGMWLARRSGYGLGLDLFNWIPGLTWFRSLHALPVRIAKSVAAYGASPKPESARAGSVETALTSPEGQVAVGYVTAGHFDCLGGAIRYGSWLVGPDHVLSEVGGDVMMIRGKQGTVPIVGKERVSLCTDMVAIRLTDTEWSSTGVKSAKLGYLENSMLASICGPGGKGTTGSIRNDNILGLLEYSGTTLAGYSGCGYFVGNQCMGIHQRGGQVNGGVALAYIDMLLQAVDGVKQESDYLIRFLKSGRKFRFRTSPGDPSELEIEAGGKYVTKSYDDVAEMIGNENLQQALGSGYYQSGKRFDHTNVPGVPESSVFPKSGSGGLSSLRNEQKPLGPVELQELTRLLMGLSKKKAVMMKKLLTPDSPTQASAGMPASSEV